MVHFNKNGVYTRIEASCYRDGRHSCKVKPIIQGGITVPKQKERDICLRSLNSTHNLLHGWSIQKSTDDEISRLERAMLTTYFAKLVYILQRLSEW
jgi:hypothetical protein